MKKLSVYMLAFAAMGLAMTSCNKDERTDYDNISVNVEENEIMNDVKIHQNGNSPVNYWDEGDRIRFIDQNGNGAIFAARTSTAIAHFQFIQNINTARAFDQDNGPIIGIFPWDGAVSARRIDLPTVQNSENGEIFKHFPLYAEEPLRPGYLFRNLCGVAKLNVTANVAIDSITITTEKYLNGAFNIDMTDPTEPMLVSRQSSHATKSVTLKLSNPQVPTNHFYRIALPPTTYNVFNHPYGKGQQGNQTYEYKINKHNLFWPVPNSAITANNKGQLRQNFGYDGYSESIPMWTNWEDAVADEEVAN